MNPSLALLLCVVGIAGFFFLNRDESVHTSKALWLPVAWVWIVGSRPVSVWLGVTPPSGTNVQLDGSPLDALVFGILVAAAIGVLISRGKRTRTFLTANGPILIYFSYCLVSVLWSDFPDVAFKRWIKAIGDLAMMLIVVTDGHPVAAIGRLLSRTGFILLPTSVVLIKYYGNLGRGYTPDGEAMNTGVTTNKNTLGLIVFILSLGALWMVRTLLIDKGALNRRRRLVAQCTLLAIGLALLQMAHSATSVACFVLGAGLILATTVSAIRNHPARVHALCLTIVLAGGAAMLAGGGADVVHALGRKSDLTGRTEIWKGVISAAGNPIVGSGFESFWNSRAAQVAQNLRDFWQVGSLNTAHNGYIEVYLNLGWIGVCLIALILTTGYRRASAACQRDPKLGSLILAYLATAAIYSIAEAGFRTLAPSWIFLLLAILASGVIPSAKDSDKRNLSGLVPAKKSRDIGTPDAQRLQRKIKSCDANHILNFSSAAKSR